jgi:hypothetical protein
MDTNENALQYEIVEEKARSLGLAAKQIVAALEALKNCAELSGDTRRALIAEAAERVYYFKIQRELCGMRDWDEVVEFYAIPGEVLTQVGSWRKAS